MSPHHRAVSNRTHLIVSNRFPLLLADHKLSAKSTRAFSLLGAFQEPVSGNRNRELDTVVEMGGCLRHSDLPGVSVFLGGLLTRGHEEMMQILEKQNGSVGSARWERRELTDAYLHQDIISCRGTPVAGVIGCLIHTLMSIREEILDAVPLLVSRHQMEA